MIGDEGSIDVQTADRDGILFVALWSTSLLYRDFVSIEIISGNLYMRTSIGGSKILK